MNASSITTSPAMSAPANPNIRRTWLLVIFSLISLLFFYLLSFGPLLYLSAKTGIEYQTWFRYSIGPAYAPHLWCMTKSEPYYDYGWWWYTLAKPAAAKATWEEWKRDR